MMPRPASQINPEQCSSVPSAVKLGAVIRLAPFEAAAGQKPTAVCMEARETYLSVLCYNLEAMDYHHKDLVEEEVDVEKTQKIEQKVERFSTMFPAWRSYDNAPAVTRVTRFLHRWSCSRSPHSRRGGKCRGCY